ncbi:bridge-like lipid transfer protein family member 1 [Paroedura picta]|uniref:bridge-like lipid transfer protein family member 1 n=1 Tax=Paroedura picta TaxID=143630 RepID=UPI00405675A3
MRTHPSLASFVSALGGEDDLVIEAEKAPENEQITSQQPVMNCYQNYLTQYQPFNWSKKHPRKKRISLHRSLDQKTVPAFKGLTANALLDRGMQFTGSTSNTPYTPLEKKILANTDDETITEEWTLDHPISQTRTTVIVEIKGTVDVVLTPLVAEALDRYIQAMVHCASTCHPAAIVDNLHFEVLREAVQNRKTTFSEKVNLCLLQASVEESTGNAAGKSVIHVSLVALCFVRIAAHVHMNRQLDLLSTATPAVGAWLVPIDQVKSSLNKLETEGTLRVCAVMDCIMTEALERDGLPALVTSKRVLIALAGQWMKFIVVTPASKGVSLHRPTQPMELQSSVPHGQEDGFGADNGGGLQSDTSADGAEFEFDAVNAVPSDMLSEHPLLTEPSSVSFYNWMSNAVGNRGSVVQESPVTKSGHNSLPTGVRSPTESACRVIFENELDNNSLSRTQRKRSLVTSEPPHVTLIVFRIGMVNRMHLEAGIGGLTREAELKRIHGSFTLKEKMKDILHQKMTETSATAHIGGVTIVLLEGITPNIRTVVKCSIAKSQGLHSAPRGLKTNNAAVFKVGALSINIPQHPAALHSMTVRRSHQLPKQISVLIRQPSTVPQPAKEDTATPLPAEKTPTSVNQMPIETSAFPQLPEGLEKKPTVLKFSARIDGIAIGASLLPSLKAEYKMGRIRSHGRTGAQKRFTFELPNHMLRCTFKVSATDMSSIPPSASLNLPPVTLSGTCIMEEHDSYTDQTWSTDELSTKQGYYLQGNSSRCVAEKSDGGPQCGDVHRLRAVEKCSIAKSQALHSAPRGLKTNNAAVFKVGALSINIPQHPATLHSMTVQSSHQLSKQISDLIRQPSTVPQPTKEDTATPLPAEKTPTSVNQTPIETSEFPQLPEGLEKKPILLKFSARTDGIAIGASLLPSLKAEYKMGRMRSHGRTGAQTRFAFELPNHRLRCTFKVSATDMSSIPPSASLNLPPVTMSVKCIMEEHDSYADQTWSIDELPTKQGYNLQGNSSRCVAEKSDGGPQCGDVHRLRTVVKCSIAKSQALHSAPRGLKTNNAAVLKVGALSINIPRHPAALHSMTVWSSHQLSKQISDLIRQPSTVPQPTKEDTATPLPAENMPTSVNQTPIETSEFPQLPEGLEKKPIVLKFSARTDGIAIGASLLPSLKAEYKMGRMRSHGRTGAQTRFTFDLPNHRLRCTFKASATDMSSIPPSASTNLPPVTMSVKCTMEEHDSYTDQTWNIDELPTQQGYYLQGNSSRCVAEVGSFEHNLTTDLLNHLVFVQKVFLKELNEVIQTVSGVEQPIPLWNEHDGTTDGEKPKILLYSFSLQFKGIQVTATTPSVRAVRFETGLTELELSNRIQTKAVPGSSSSLKLFGKCQVDLNPALGQSVKHQVYEEAGSDFHQVASFKTGIGLRKALREEIGGSSDRAAVLITLNRPVVFAQPVAFDRAVLFWLNYKAAYDNWSEQRLALRKDIHMATKEIVDMSPGIQQTSAQALGTLFLQLAVNDLGICLPITSAPQSNHSADWDTGSALVLTTESTLITACSSESLVSEGHLKNFCIRFVDGFETSWDDWKPEVRGDLVVNACVVPDRTYEVCSRTTGQAAVESNSAGTWTLNVLWKMCGIDVHMDPNIGTRSNALGNTLTTLTGEEDLDDIADLNSINMADFSDEDEVDTMSPTVSMENAECRRQGTANNQTGEQRGRKYVKHLVDIRERNEQAKAIGDLKKLGASEGTIYQEIQRYQPLESVAVNDIGRDVRKKLRRSSMRFPEESETDLLPVTLDGPFHYSSTSDGSCSVFHSPKTPAVFSPNIPFQPEGGRRDKSLSSTSEDSKNDDGHYFYRKAQPLSRKKATGFAAVHPLFTERWPTTPANRSVTGTTTERDIDFELDVSVEIDCGKGVLHPTRLPQEHDDISLRRSYDRSSRSLDQESPSKKKEFQTNYASTTHLLAGKKVPSSLRTKSTDLETTVFYIPGVDVKLHYNSEMLKTEWPNASRGSSLPRTLSKESKLHAVGSQDEDIGQFDMQDPLEESTASLVSSSTFPVDVVVYVRVQVRRKTARLGGSSGPVEVDDTVDGKMP